MKLIVSFLVFIFSLVFPFSALAAPSTSISATKDRKFVNLSFSDLKKVSKVSYTLVYDTDRGQRGFEGGFKVNPKVSRSVRRQILGSCSSSKCVYQRGVKNLQLNVTFFLRSGGSTTLSRSLL